MEAGSTNRLRCIRNTVASLAAVAFLLSLQACHQRAESLPIVANPQLLSALLAQYPMSVSVSPTSKLLLLKARHKQEFEIFVVDRTSHKIIASDRSPDTQLSLTWRPDGQAVAFQESQGGNRQYHLYLFELRTGKRRQLNARVTETAAPPLRWNPTGDKLAWFQTTGSEDGEILTLDLKNESLSPAIVLDGIAWDGDFIWSPNGQCIAAVSARDKANIIVVNLTTLDRKAFAVSAGGRVRQLAWAPNGKSLLTAARLPGKEFFQLYEIDLEHSDVTQRAAYNGDISLPLWLPNGESFIYHINQQGNTVPYVGFRDGSPSRMLGFTNGVNQVQTVLPDGKGALLLAKSPLTPPSLYEIKLDNNRTNLIYSSPSTSYTATVPPEVVQLTSQDGRSIPTIVWRAPLTTPMTNFVLIEVHAGPRIQSTPEWDAAKQFLVRKGVHILSVDYRGSSGYGASFEDGGDQSRQVDDIVAACNYATDILKAPKRGIVLLGFSYGSMLAAEAALRKSDLIAAVILTSAPALPSPSPPHQEHLPRIYGFHGQNDPSCAPSRARLSIEQYFGSKSLDPPRGHWEAFPNEGHHFHRTISWAKVYTTILESIFATTPQENPKE